MIADNERAQRARSIFATNFKTCLTLAGKTQSDVANELGITSSTVSDWANAKKYPRVDKMQALADYLGVRISDLRDEKPAASEDDELLNLLKNDDVKRIVKKMAQLTPRNLELALEQLDVLVRHQ